MIELKSKTGSVKLTTPKATGGTVDLSNYYTKEQTDEQIQVAIDGIEIPEVDLSGYPTFEDMSDYVTESELEAEGYATTSYVDTAIEQFDVDLTGYATEIYVQEQITAIDIPETDLSNYYTKEEVEALIPKYESGEGVEY